MSQNRIAILQMPEDATDSELQRITEWLRKNEPPGLKIIVSRHYAVLSRQDILKLLEEAKP
jgi:hypothetical protein